MVVYRDKDNYYGDYCSVILTDVYAGVWQCVNRKTLAGISPSFLCIKTGIRVNRKNK